MPTSHFILDDIGGPLLILLFGVLVWVQWKHPLRRRHFGALRRIARNLVFSVPSQIVARWLTAPLPLAAAAWAESRHVGLLNLLALPLWAKTIASFVLLDYAYWWWHWVNHRVPFFWRFHNVHHTDLDMDVSTAARFHFLDLAMSAVALALGAVVFGVPPVVLVAFLVTFEIVTMFQHSNWRLPLGLERAINRVLVTPRMHGIHHSIVERETNSNWGTVFMWWDRLHGTLRRDIPQDAVTIGVAAYRDEKELTLGQLFLLPFRPLRPWQMRDGTIPQREDRPADPSSALPPDGSTHSSEETRV